MGDRGKRLVALACKNTLEKDIPSSTSLPTKNVRRCSSDSSDLDETQMDIANQLQNILNDDYDIDTDIPPSTITSLPTNIVTRCSSDSSDLNETRLDIANQLNNIFNDDFDVDTDDDVRLFGSDYSDKDPDYVPDLDHNSQKQIESDSNSIPESPKAPEDPLITPRKFSMSILDNILERVWISVTNGSDNNFYVADSDEDTPNQEDFVCNRIIIPESPRAHSQLEETAEMIIECILDRVWVTVKPLKRCKRAQPEEWKKNIAKKRKIEGLPYVTKGITRPGKVPKPIKCDKCIYKCTEKFSSEERDSLCRHFYKMDFKAKKNFILSCIQVQPVKTRRLQKISSKKDRSYSKKCYFQKNNEKIQVCQKFFVATLCISVDVISDALNKADSLGLYTAEDKRGKKSPPNKTKKEDIKFVKDHIESFPVIESHYCRKDSKKKYLYPDVKSTLKMYSLYKTLCNESHKKPVSESKYREIFNEEYNFSFFNPKKDLCNLCTKYEKSESKEDLEVEYREHIQRKVVCQEAKDADKIRANTDKTFMSITVDLQAVLQIPNSGESILYYMRKLVLYNFTIYEASLPNNAHCLCWSELNGKKGSCEIGTCLFYYLSSQLPRAVTELSIFSDTCSGQNRNQYISALLLWAVQNIDHLQIIEQKFLESGHSHMEVDSMHAAIENASKNMSINSVSDWKNVFRLARTKKTKTIKTHEGNKKIEVNNYTVKEFKYDEILDLKKLSATVMKNKNKDSNKETVNWLKIKRIRYVKGDLKIYFNYDMSNNFRQLDVFNTNANTPKTRSKRHSNPSSVAVPLSEELEHLYTDQLPISVAKKKDLQTMCKKKIIPEEFHGWIRNLKTTDDVSQASDED